MAGQQINTLFVTKYLGLTYYQIFDVSFRRRQIIGQASGTVGYIHGFFQDRYFQIRLIALGTACGTHPGCISSDNDKFHGSLLFEYVDFNPLNR
jgi:hypothetical protein